MTLESLVPAIVARIDEIFQADSLTALAYDDPDYDEKARKALHDNGVTFSVAYVYGENIGDPSDLELRNYVTVVVAEDRPRNQTGKTVYQLAAACLKGLVAEDYPGAPSPFSKDDPPLEAESREDSRLYTYFVNITANTQN